MGWKEIGNHLIGLLGGFLLIFILVEMFYREDPTCISSNPELLQEVIDYADSEGGCVCDGGSCNYWCEKYREIKKFNDSCKLGGVCIGSWC